MIYPSHVVSYSVIGSNFPFLFLRGERTAPNGSSHSWENQLVSSSLIKWLVDHRWGAHELLIIPANRIATNTAKPCFWCSSTLPRLPVQKLISVVIMLFWANGESTVFANCRSRLSPPHRLDQATLLAERLLERHQILTQSESQKMMTSQHVLPLKLICLHNGRTMLKVGANSSPRRRL